MLLLVVLPREGATQSSKMMNEKNTFNLWDGLSVTFFVQRCFCIFPLKRQGNEIVRSLFATIYSIASLICYYCCITWAFYTVTMEKATKKVATVRQDDFSKSYLILVIVVFELIFNNIGIFVIVLFSLIKRNNQILFLKKIYDIDLVILNQLKVNINYKRLRIICYLAYLIIFSYYTGLMAFVFYKLYQYQYLTLGASLMAFLYQFEQSTTGITTWNYICYVTLLYQRFVMLRKRQEDIVKEKKMMLKSGIQFTENVSMLSTILMTYKELCSCIDVLNDLSGSILILRIAHDFTLTTSQVYLISWIIMDNTDSDKYELVFSVFLWMFQNIVKLGMTTLLTECTIVQVSSLAKFLLLSLM